MKFRLFLLFLFCAITANAQTTINQDTVFGLWTVANSPYLIENNIIIPAGKKLTIEPGVQVQFKGNTGLTVYGSLHAVGTPTDTIRFTTRINRIPWRQIRIINTDSTNQDSTIIAYSIIERCFITVQDTIQFKTGALFLTNASKVYVDNVLFRDNMAQLGNVSIIPEASSLYALNSKFRVSNSVFFRDELDIHASNIIQVLNSTSEFENNVVDSSSGYHGSSVVFRGGTGDLKNITIKNGKSWSQTESPFEQSLVVEGGKFNLSLINIQNNQNAGGLQIRHIDSSSQLTNINIVNNQFNTRNGALYYVGHNKVKIYNSIFANNSRVGVRISQNDSSEYGINRLSLINCVIADNGEEAISRHLAYFDATDSCIVELRNCIIWGNNEGVTLSNPGKERVDVYYSDIQYPWTKLNMHEGNLHASPEFYNTSNFDYHITTNSPCVDAGDPRAFYNDKKRSSIAGLGGARNDMGAYGGVFNSWNADVQANFLVSDTLGKAPFIVHFTDKTINQPTDWKWDFNGDGFIDSYDQNPTYTYTHSGKFSVTLISSKRGSADTMTVKDCIEVPRSQVSGSVAGNWIHDTIKVVGDIYIPLDSVLTIKPNTVVYFAGNYGFTVYGQLIANGTPSERIKFVTDSLYESGGYYYGWKGIHFSNVYSNNQPYSQISYSVLKNVVGSALQFTNARTSFMKNILIDNFSGYGINSLASEIIFDSISVRNGISAFGLYGASSTIGINKGTFSKIGDGSAIRVTGSLVDIKYTTIDSNTVRYDYGGGINSLNTDLTLTNVIFKYNSAERGGGGLYVKGENNILLQSVEFNNNIATNGGGGGAAFLDCQPKLYNVIVNANHSSDWGGGLFINTVQNWQTLHTATIENCIISKNISTGDNKDGGGIYLGYNVAAKITNSTIVDNKATHWGGLYSENTSLPHYFKNLIVHNNGPDYSFQAGAGPYVYSLIQGNYNGMDTTTTNLNGVSPLFIDTVAGNYHLQSVQGGFSANSQAIDSGDPAIADNYLGLDFGLLTSRSDMGAYGGARNTWVGNYNPPCYYSGKVRGVWSCETVSVVGDIYINRGDTLVINPGTKVLFLNDSKLTVNGVLIAEGTEEAGITFTAADTVLGWRGITFSGLDTSSVGASKINYATFSYSQAKGTGVEKRGGAIYINKSSNVSIKNSTFYRNKADELGGAVFVSQSAPTINNCKYENNSAVLAGGAIYFDNVNNGLYRKLQISGNKAKEGAGIFFDHSSPKLTNLLIEGNSTTIEGVGSGGGMFFYYSSPVMANITSSLNFAGNGGGSIGLNGTCNPTIVNSIFAYDKKPEIDYNPSIYNFTLKYSIIEGGAGANYMGTGSLDTLPDFISLTQHNFHLQSILCGFWSNSAGVDDGHPDSIDTKVTCGYGLGNYRADMGFYGGRYAEPTVSIEETPKDKMPTEFGLEQNYPNPFNPSTIIRYHLPVAGATSITVYDILGREVTKLVDEYKQAGTHNVSFNAGHLASGVYIYRIKSGNFMQSKKLLLVK